MYFNHWIWSSLPDHSTKNQYSPNPFCRFCFATLAPSPFTINHLIKSRTHLATEPTALALKKIVEHHSAYDAVEYCSTTLQRYRMPPPIDPRVCSPRMYRYAKYYQLMFCSTCCPGISIKDMPHDENALS